MNSSGTRVVPTLTEVLDEQRLSKPVSKPGAEAWLDSRRADEDLVPISLDWGDEAPTADPATPVRDAEAAMTPWQIVQPRTPALPGDDAPFIDLSIDVAPVQAPALHAQVLEVFALPPQAAVPASAPEAASAAEPDAPAGGPLAELPPEVSSEHDEAVAFATPAAAQGLPVLPQAVTGCAEAAADLAVTGSVAAAAAAYTPVPASVLNMLAAAGAASMAPAPSFAQPHSLQSPLDPGRDAVRQGGEHVPGISEERLQAIIQQALDRLLRDELPSALVETLIRLSPQLSESLIESLKPSLHLHVLEALSAEPPAPQEGRRPG